jgi:hypothetical protein
MFSHGGRTRLSRGSRHSACFRAAAKSDANIDHDRFRHQDEYVEWRSEFRERITKTSLIDFMESASPVSERDTIPAAL